jgi:thiol-disulfide isomerase/thioredoxin
MPKILSRIFFTAFVFFITTNANFAQTNFIVTKKITGAELKTLAKSNNGKPVLINFWATWCGPCRVEFPELVAIDRDYKAKGLNFRLVSVDDFAVIDTRVPEFLREYEATMPSYLIDLPNRVQIARAVRQIAPGFVDRYPLTLLFNANGKLVYQKIGVIDAKILRKEIDKVLPKNTNTVEVKNKEIQVQLTPFGYISLPKGYWTFMDADYMDAWGGLIESLNGDFKIRFSDGIIVSVFDGEDKNIKWKKELKTENYSINYALTDNGKTKRVLAKIKSANFSALIENDSDVIKFLEIISKYRIGRCEKCFNSHNTKGLRKFFEKYNEND